MSRKSPYAGELEVPDWLKYKGKTFTRTLSVVDSTVCSSGIATVCKEARCPNRTECWSSGTATFMLMGDTCTRNCRFCSVKSSVNPAPLNPDEPKNIAQALHDWDLNYVVLTSVDRDDLPDGGAEHLAKCIKEIKAEHPDLRIEILIPDFQGSIASLKKIVNAGPDVIAHNIETIRRLQKKVRDPLAEYDQSLKILRGVKELNPNILTKSSIMVGLGETYDEVIETMQDLRNVGVELLTIGQYMRPTFRNLRVKAYVEPEVFTKWESDGRKMGYLYVASGPLIRSSYRAGEYFITKVLNERFTPKSA